MNLKNRGRKRITHTRHENTHSSDSCLTNIEACAAKKRIIGHERTNTVQEMIKFFSGCCLSSSLTCRCCKCCRCLCETKQYCILFIFPFHSPRLCFIWSFSFCSRIRLQSKFTNKRLFFPFLSFNCCLLRSNQQSRKQFVKAVAS